MAMGRRCEKIRGHCFAEVIGEVVKAVRHTAFVSCSQAAWNHMGTYGRPRSTLLAAAAHGLGTIVQVKFDTAEFEMLTAIAPMKMTWGCTDCNLIA